ncbi:MAG TPA: alpha/beta fold hydrolase [Dermatophilaceae bacterium]|nr:alpha/beta fold hydrolase [Dermatophilaceae bacterium]
MVSRRLHHLSVGTAGPRIAFCHGLFGQGRNWTQVAKALAGPDGTEARATLIDLPDHGRSPWTDHFSLQGYAAHVAQELRTIAPGERWTLVGHSLGGKVSMLVALAQPDLVEKLAVVDIAPRHYRSHHWYLDYIAAMQALPLDSLTSRAEADELLAPVVPVASVRSFLLQNLRRHGHTWSWQVNFDVLAGAGTGQRSVAGWPVVDATAYPPFDGPVLWVAGSESTYVRSDDTPAMRALFPKVRQVTVKGAAHWVHSDQPEVTIQILDRFLRADVNRRG